MNRHRSSQVKHPSKDMAKYLYWRIMGLDRRMCRPGGSIYQYHLASGHSHRRWHIICNLSGVLKHLPMSIAIWVNTVKRKCQERKKRCWKGVVKIDEFGASRRHERPYFVSFVCMKHARNSFGGCQGWNLHLPDLSPRRRPDSWTFEEL